MPYSGAPIRHTAIATKNCVHGQVVVEDNRVGSAFKAQQVDRWVKPVDAKAIAVGEEFEVQVNDILEVPVSGPLADIEVGDKVFIVAASNVLATATATGSLPVGIVDEIDETRTPAVARVDTTAWHAFA